VKAVQILIRGWLVIGMAATVIFFPGLAANIMIGVFMIIAWADSEMTVFQMDATSDVVLDHDHTVRRLVSLARMQL
jgi:hypothetical protein